MKVLLLFATVLAIICVPAFAHTTLVDTSIPISDTKYDPCSGEVIDYAGNAHLLITGELIAGDTMLRLMIHVNLQGVTAVGQTSGKKYQLQDNRKRVIELSSGEFDMTFRNYVRVVGQGSIPDLKFLQTTHIILISGQPPVVEVNFEDECKPQP